MGAFLLILAQLAFQSLRQWAVVPRDLGLSLFQVVHAFVLGEWLNIFTPARAGDALKVVLIRQESGGSLKGVPSATGAVLADKVIDIVTLVLLCMAAGLIGLLWERVRAGLLAAAVAGAVGVALVVALRLRRISHGRWRIWLQELGGGLSGLRDHRRLIASVFFSFGAWVAEGGALWVLCHGLGVAPAPSAILLALVVLNVGISVPISFANLGVYEAALASGLGLAGVPLTTALAVAASHHGLELLAQNVAAGGLSLSTLAVRRSSK
jgi:uncharacterized membrane protein YbhN (UPF0104 family)